jgi:hypothetical protein
MSFGRSVLMGFLVFGLALSAAGQGTTAPVITRSSAYDFAPVGLGTTETLQVNVANLASNPTTGAAASCAASVAFLSATGTAIGTASTLTATAGETVSAKLPSGAQGTGTHIEVRVVVTLTQTSGVPCTPVYTLETYDSSSGATHVYVTANGPASLLIVQPQSLR